MGLIPLGILSSAGSSQVVGAYELIESRFLASNTASVTFSNLGDYATTYKHLQVRATLRDAGANTSWGFRFNSDSSNSYARHQLEGNGSNVVAGAGTSESAGFLGGGANSGSGANIFTALIIDIVEPFSTTKNKTIRVLGGCAAPNTINLVSSLWVNTSSATSLQIYSRFGTDIAANSRLSLYGIR
jgi:hypothetical protein